MPVIARLNNAKIQMFADDHAPPHFHPFGPNSNALIAIGTLTVIRGAAPMRARSRRGPRPGSDEPPHPDPGVEPPE